MLFALSASRKDTMQTSVLMSSQKPLTNLLWKTLCPLTIKPPRRNHGESVLPQPALLPRLPKSEVSSTCASTVATGISPTRVRNTKTPARRLLMDQRHRLHRLPPQAHPMLSLYASDLATSPLTQPLNEGDTSWRAHWLAGQVFDHSQLTDEKVDCRFLSQEYFSTFEEKGPVLFDTGCTIALSPCRDDFVRNLVPDSSSVAGLSSDCSVQGKGYVLWCFEATVDGSSKSQVLLTLPTFYVPQSRMRLLSPQVLTTWFNGSISQASAGAPFVVTWHDTVTNRMVRLKAPLLPASWVPALTMRGPSPHLQSFDVTSFLQSARAALVAAPSFVTDDSNVNLTAHQKILLHVLLTVSDTLASMSYVLWLVKVSLVKLHRTLHQHPSLRSATPVNS